MNNWFRKPVLTRRRIWLALAVAIAADGLQMLLGPLGWMVADQVIDVIAMILSTLLLGFHFLFLPTFVVEFLPAVDMLPTWTGCVAAVVALRRRQPPESQAPPPVPAAPPSDAIDI